MDIQQSDAEAMRELLSRLLLDGGDMLRQNKLDGDSLKNLCEMMDGARAILRRIEG